MERNISIGGIFAPEIKAHGKRSGFGIIDIMTGQKGVLACKGCKGPEVGNYGVNLEDLENIGVRALENALETSEYILIDEIAPMELKSPKFSKVIEKVFASSKNVIAIIHKKSNNPVITDIKNRDDVILFDVNVDNRDLVYEEIIELGDL